MTQRKEIANLDKAEIEARLQWGASMFLDPLRIDFLDCLSRAIFESRAARDFPDLITFGYKCRRGNLMMYKAGHKVAPNVRKYGIGAVLHITPSNIPLNFAYSWMSSFIAGNTNIVRLPSADFPQIDLLLDLIHKTFSRDQYQKLGTSTLFFRSEKGDPRLLEVVGRVQGLVVWGGDSTVEFFRKAAVAPSVRFLAFSDRVSSLVIGSNQFLQLVGDEESRIRIMKHLYNDTFMVDCNACSSPSQIFFVGENQSNLRAIEKLASCLGAVVEETDYTAAHVARLLDSLDRYNPASEPHELEHVGPGIHFLRVDQGDAMPSRALRYGVFAVHKVSSIEGIKPLIRHNEQTISHVGLSEGAFDGLQELLLSSPTRLVPVGSALDMDFYWDGYDIPSQLTKFATVSM